MDTDLNRVFQVQPSSGTIEAGDTQTIRALFNPIRAEEYEHKAALYINDQKDKPYLELTMRG